LHQYQVDDLGSATKNAQLRGSAVVELRRVVVLHEFPLQEGATFTLERRKLTVRKVSYSQEHLEVELTYEQVSLLLRGETTGRYTSLQFVLINEPRHEWVEPSGASGGGGPSAANYSNCLERIDYNPDRFTPVRFTDDWIRGARLLLLSSESGGTLTVPFAFQGIDLFQ
jgi:hypothetical protein